MTGDSQRVALVLASSTGGVGRHVAMLAAGLVSDGYQVSVCGPADTQAMFGFVERGARFHPVDIPARPNPGDLTAVWALRRALRDGGRPAVIHAHSLRAGLVAALARPAGVPLVVTWHNVVMARGLRARLYAGLERYVARAADVTLGVSADLVQRVRELGGREVRRAAVPAPALPAPVRPAREIRAEFGITGGQPLILAVGRLHPQKGFDVLISAAARWRDRRPRPFVAVAGSGPAYLGLAARASQLRAPVSLLGNRDDVPDLLAAADVVVVTSVWEGQPLFVQEALTAGAALVATEVGGIPDLVGQAALLVPAGDVDAVDLAVQRLLDDADLRAELRARGPAQAATWSTEADAVAQVEAVYGALSADGRR